MNHIKNIYNKLSTRVLLTAHFQTQNQHHTTRIFKNQLILQINYI